MLRIILPSIFPILLWLVTIGQCSGQDSLTNQSDFFKSVEKDSPTVARELLESYRTQSDEEIIKMLTKSKDDGQNNSNIITNSPKIINLIVRILKDEDAIPFLAGIIDTPEKVSTFLVLVVIGFIIRFFLKRRNRALKDEPGYLSRILFTFGFFWGYQIFMFLLMFGSEFKPLINICIESLL